METITIREATQNDIESIAILHVLTWQCAYKGIVPESYLNSLSIENRKEKWNTELENVNNKRRLLVAEIEKKVVGFCYGGPSRDEDKDQNKGEVYGLYVHKDYINKGVGTKLISTMVIFLKTEGYTKATLWTLKNNPNSRSFYERRGWRVEGKEKKDARDNFFLEEIRYIYNLQ